MLFQIQLNFSELLHHPPGGRHEALTLGREPGMAPIAVHQLQANVELQFAHQLAQGRLGHVATLGCQRKISQLTERNHGPQGACRYVDHELTIC